MGKVLVRVIVLVLCGSTSSQYPVPRQSQILAQRPVRQAAPPTVREIRNASLQTKIGARPCRRLHIPQSYNQPCGISPHVKTEKDAVKVLSATGMRCV